MPVLDHLQVEEAREQGPERGQHDEPRDAEPALEVEELLLGIAQLRRVEAAAVAAPPR